MVTTLESTDKPYVGDVGTVMWVNTTEDISAATVTEFKVKKPDGTIVTWTATVVATTYLRYVIQAGDFNLEGMYRVNAYVELPAWTGRGETFYFRVYDPFN